MAWTPASKLNASMVPSRETYVRLSNGSVTGWAVRARAVPHVRLEGARAAPAALPPVMTQGTPVCTVRKYTHLSGTESGTQQ